MIPIARSLIVAACLLLGVARAEVIGLWSAPGDEPERAIVAQFAQAQRTIDYQMYNFTSQPVAEALIAARRRGVEVTLLLDHTASLSIHCQAQRCAAAGCRVLIDGKHPIAHNKVRIIDGRLLLGGSYNDSAQAHKNAENLYLENGAAAVQWYLARFREHAAHALDYEASLAADHQRARAKGSKR